MKKAKKILALLFVFVVLISISCIDSFAASITKDDLEVTLVTDKDNYEVTDQIKTTLTVKNEGDTAVNDVNMENLLPDGYKLADKSVSQKTVESLSAGETATLTSTLVKDSENKKDDAAKDKKATPGQTSNDSNTTSSSTSSNSGAIQTGQALLIAGILLFVLLVSAAVFILARRKKLDPGKNSKRFLSLILCFAVLECTFMFFGVTVRAEEAEDATDPTGVYVELETVEISDATQRPATPVAPLTSSSDKSTISLTLSVKVGTEDITIASTVTYPSIEQALPKPDNPTDAENYYWDNSEKVIRVIGVEDSDRTLTESEAVKLLRERGFTDYPVTYSYNLDGEFTDDTAASDSSSDKHPFYETNYLSENDCVWRISVIDGDIFANPISYKLESNAEYEVLFSESNKLTSYNNDDNKFFVTIPKGAVVKVKKLDVVTADTLDKITSEEVYAE